MQQTNQSTKRTTYASLGLWHSGTSTLQMMSCTSTSRDSKRAIPQVDTNLYSMPTHSHLTIPRVEQF